MYPWLRAAASASPAPPPPATAGPTFSHRDHGGSLLVTATCPCGWTTTIALAAAADPEAETALVEATERRLARWHDGTRAGFHAEAADD